jgi:lipopolysaccharide/colanic/teichoic acid biosynthesis glycosyltransferase
VLKRAFDILLALIGLVVLSPLFIVIALLVLWKLGRPVFFLQTRPGRGGVPFRLIKFRSMTNACDEAGRPLPAAQRLTPFGRFLRSTSLDELPELWNILRGDMSFVGPRPLLMEYLPLYSAEQARRHEARPGLTGWAAIHGRNAVGWDERFRLDVWYVDNRSFLLDLRILLVTLTKVLRREGITEPGQATMTPFRGSGADHPHGDPAELGGRTT